jgi:hypothetical protein
MKINVKDSTMKKLLVLLIGVISVLAQEITIEKNKEFQLETLPDIYKSSFSIRMENSHEKPIETNFQNLINVVNKTDICEGGTYNIYPNTQNNTFHGYINFTCEFRLKDEYEQLLDKVKSFDGKLSQGRITLSNTQKSIQDTQNRLERMALQFPFDYSLFLQKTLSGFECEASKVSFDSSGHNPTPYLLRSAKATSQTVVTPPIQEQIVHSLRVNYTFKCQN